MQNTLTGSSRFADLPLFSGKTFTLFVLFFTVVMEALISELGFPPTIRYINDFLILILLLTILADPAHLCAKVGGPVICVTLLLLLTFSVSSIINGVKPLLYLWAFRNTFRGFIFFSLVSGTSKKMIFREPWMRYWRFKSSVFSWLFINILFWVSTWTIPGVFLGMETVRV